MKIGGIQMVCKRLWLTLFVCHECGHNGDRDNDKEAYWGQIEQVNITAARQVIHSEAHIKSNLFNTILKGVDIFLNYILSEGLYV